MKPIGKMRGLFLYDMLGPPLSQNDSPVSQNHHLKMTTQHSKNTTFLKTKPHIVGNFWLPLWDPNEYLKVLLEILRSLVINRVFKHVKWPLQGWEKWVFTRLLKKRSMWSLALYWKTLVIVQAVIIAAETENQDK